MEIKFSGDIKGNVIEKIEPGNIIVGFDNRSVALDLTNSAQMEILTQELLNLKATLSKEQGKESTCAEIDEAVTAIQSKDKSKLKKALQSIGRECANVAEGVLGSLLASLIITGLNI